MFEQVLVLATATMILLGSPGPAPLALAATSAAFGVKKSLPFLMGLMLGFILANVITVTGFTLLFSDWPRIKYIY